MDADQSYSQQIKTEGLLGQTYFSSDRFVN